MVRKRITKRYIKEESDESDSDDFYEEPDTDKGGAKKYSLRQRREANFAEDFDYDLVEEPDSTPAATDELLRSDDEDFDVQDANEEAEKGGTTSSKPREPKPKKTLKVNTSTANCTITKYKDRELEPDIPKDKQSSEDMIDFEDVIRADILVNKSRIDYDSIIEKTEIKVERKKPEDYQNIEPPRKSNQKNSKMNKDNTPAKKRGRKPKKQKLEEEAAELEEQCYESYMPEPDSAGLPINTVLGVTESLYELAERYQMEGGTFSGEIDSLPIETTHMKENVSSESTESGFIENEIDCNVPKQEPELEAIQTC